MFDLNKKNWPECQFSEIAEQISERIDPAESDAEVYVGLEHIEPNSIHINEYGKPSDVKGTKLKVYKGDIIFGKRRAYQRKAAIADFDGICSAHAMVLRAKPKIMIPELFPFFLHSDAFMNRAIDISEGSLSPTIKWKILAKQKFTIPPLDEQKKLADLLWAADELFQQYSEMLNKVNVYFETTKSSLFKSNHYKLIRINELTNLFSGYSFKSSKYASEGHRVIRITNLQSGKIVDSDPVFYNISDEKSIKKFILRENDILVSLTGYVGKVGIIEKDLLPAVLNQRVACVRPKDPTSISYIFHLMNSNKFESLCIAHSSGSAQKNLSSNDLGRIKIPIPESNTEMLSITNKLQTIDSVKVRLKENLENILRVNKNIINNLFS
jgi:type I restriction enzyme S subunit